MDRLRDADVGVPVLRLHTGHEQAEDVSARETGLLYRRSLGLLGADVDIYLVRTAVRHGHDDGGVSGCRMGDHVFPRRRWIGLRVRLAETERGELVGGVVGRDEGEGAVGARVAALLAIQEKVTIVTPLARRIVERRDRRQGGRAQAGDVEKLAA